MTATAQTPQQAPPPSQEPAKAEKPAVPPPGKENDPAGRVIEIAAAPGAKPKTVLTKFEGNMWDQQPGEPPQWFAAFQLYKLMGKDRSIKAVENTACSISQPQTPTKSRKKHQNGHIGKKSTEWRWVDRAHAYDVHLTQIQSKAKENWLVRAAEAQAKAMAHLTELVAEASAPGEGSLERLKELLPRLATLIGKEKAGDFILGAHKVIHGEKVLVAKTIRLRFE